VQVVGNGGFESGTTPWTQSSAGGYQLIVTQRAHTGTHSAWLCGYSSCNDQISQTLTLPTTFNKLTLSYWYYSDSLSGTTSCTDYFYARVKTTDGSVITTPQQACNTSVTNGWVQQTYDLTSALASYTGQQVVLSFQGTTASAKQSDFFVDDVSLIAGGAPAPAATPTPVQTSTVVSGACPGSGCVQSMLNILNTDRSNNGVAPLALNTAQTNGSGSCVGSIGHSQAMQQSGSIWHTNPSYPSASFPNNICVSYMAAGENVGQAGSGNELGDLQQLDNLMMSEPHDASTCASTVNHACNTINPTYKSVGIGIVYVNNQTWLTEDFIG
jgi:uncharacterized protein YkwD